MTHSHDLLGQPPATLLADTPAAREALERGDDLAQIAAAFPTYPAVWAALADKAYANGSIIESYAYARTGYHRSLDALRRSGWKGHGPVPWSHAPNQGYLRCVNALARAAGAIGERDEAMRCGELLHDSDPTAAAALG